MPQPTLTKKKTLIPIALAFLIPAILVILLFANNRPQPVAGTSNQTVPQKPPAQMAYFQIKVLDTEGQPMENRVVTFRHETSSREITDERTLLTEVNKQTDSAGIATITLEKQGHVTVQVQDRDKQEKFKDLELASSTLYELTIILENPEK